jgi:hypothetical protein
MAEEAEKTWRGKVGGMSAAEVDAFLERGIAMRLACLKPNGDPYITVCWHEWRDGYFWVIPRQRSVWAEHMKNDPRVAFVVDVPESVEKVQGEGLAECVEEPNIGGRWVGIAERMSVRYLGEHGPTYLVPTLNQPRWLFRIKPTKMQTWQGVGWARRFWVEETGGPTYEDAHAAV